MTLTPHERMMIALRNGVLVRRKATMRFAADVVHHTVQPESDDRFTVVPVEAASAADAARKVAEIAAARRYEKDGSVGFLSPTSRGPGWFRAAIGVQVPSEDGIRTAGVTVSIHVWPVD
jgi:hypothetical protein